MHRCVRTWQSVVAKAWPRGLRVQQKYDAALQDLKAAAAQPNAPGADIAREASLVAGERDDRARRGDTLGRCAAVRRVLSPAPRTRCTDDLGKSGPSPVRGTWDPRKKSKFSFCVHPSNVHGTSG